MDIPWIVCICWQHVECKETKENWGFFPSCKLSDAMSSMREVFVAIRYAKACDKKSSRQRVSFRRHHFKSGKGYSWEETTANSQCFVVEGSWINEKELKLLPLKDFWDATKKEWKKNVFGTFAKRKSVTMKNIFGLAWTNLKVHNYKRKPYIILAVWTLLSMFFSTKS